MLEATDLKQSRHTNKNRLIPKFNFFEDLGIHPELKLNDFSNLKKRDLKEFVQIDNPKMTRSNKTEWKRVDQRRLYSPNFGFPRPMIPLINPKTDSFLEKYNKFGISKLNYLMPKPRFSQLKNNYTKPKNSFDQESTQNDLSTKYHQIDQNPNFLAPDLKKSILESTEKITKNSKIKIPTETEYTRTKTISSESLKKNGLLQNAGFEPLDLKNSSLDSIKKYFSKKIISLKCLQSLYELDQTGLSDADFRIVIRELYNDKIRK